jgi:UDP-GlcNAc:undecaprenyl-phosphate/decaprenyl-phosphate GlcNAc-1-phosphate transferase
MTIYLGSIFTHILTGLGLALIVGLGTIWLAPRIGLMDIPGILPHKKHASPTPLAGGLTLVVSLLIGMLLLKPALFVKSWNILLPAGIIFAVGIWDDYKRLRARYKLIGQIGAAILLIALGTQVQVIKPGFLGLEAPVTISLNWFITLFWVVGITNAMNFIDSMDGLSVGVGGIALCFMIMAMWGPKPTALFQVLTLLLGICGGIYFYNISPARVFMGDSGAQTLGFLLAAAGILFTPAGRPQASSWFVPILVLGVPIFDMTLVVVSRLLRRKAVYSAGHDHSYHRLVKIGLESNRAVICMHIAAVVMGCLALICFDMPPLPANLTFGGICLAGLGLLIFLERRWRQWTSQP